MSAGVILLTAVALIPSLPSSSKLASLSTYPPPWRRPSPPPSLPPSPPPLPRPRRFAELERSLGEAERARAVYELAIAQQVLDMPEILWKVRQSSIAGMYCCQMLCGGTCRQRCCCAGAACTDCSPPSAHSSPLLYCRPVLPCLYRQAYIDFEIGEGNREGARELYERLLQRTRHVKVGGPRGSIRLAGCPGVI